jgi:hypothetical protein
MNPFDLYHATAEAAIAYMKKPDNLKPLEDLCTMVADATRREQRARDIEEAKGCEVQIVFGCPLFKAPTTVMDAKTGKITGAREHGDD